MWLLLAFLACSNRPPHPSAPAEPAPVTAPEPAPTADPTAMADPECVEKCLHDNMARPVAREVMEADCRATCTAETLVTGGPDLALRLGQRVLAEGRFGHALHHGHGPEPYMGSALVLSDNTPLWVSTGDAPAALQQWLGKNVRMEGTLAPGPEGDPGIWLEEIGTIVATPAPAPSP